MMNLLRAYWMIVTERDGLWHSYGVDQMRRWVDGAWQFRQMTEEEATTALSDTQW